MSSVTRNLPEIRRHPEAMYVRFADLPCEVSLEVADNFIVDFSPDDDIVGLEILWEDTDRDGSEPALLAFGMFTSAVVWLGYHHGEHSKQEFLGTVFRKVKGFIAATDLQLQVGYRGNTGLTIRDENGKPLICADFGFYPQRVLKSGWDQNRKSPAELLDDEVGKIRSAIKNLAENVLCGKLGAVGVAVFVDSTGFFGGP